MVSDAIDAASSKSSVNGAYPLIASLLNAKSRLLTQARTPPPFPVICPLGSVMRFFREFRLYLVFGLPIL